MSKSVSVKVLGAKLKPQCICVLGPTYPIRGAIPLITTMVAKTLRECYEVNFFSIRRGYPSWLFPGRSTEDRSSGVPRFAGVVPSLDFLNPVSWLATAVRIIRRRPALLYIPWWVVAWAPQFLSVALMVRLFSRARILFDCHNVEEHESGPFKNMLTRLVLSSAHHLVVHSEVERRKAQRLYPGKQISLVRLPIFDFFKPSGLSPAAAKRCLGLKGRVLLFFGLIRPYKGLAQLLKAMALIKDELEVTLLVAGEIWQGKEEYLRLIRQGGLEQMVVMHDRYIAFKEAEKYFLAADILVMPYMAGTGSAVSKTAYAFGIPVLGTRAADLPETIEDGRTGFLVRRGSPRALAQAILRFYRQADPDSFKRHIRRKCQEFSWRNYVLLMNRLLVKK